MVMTLLLAVLSLPGAAEEPVAVSSLPLTGAVFPSPHELVRGPAAAPVLPGGCCRGQARVVERGALARARVVLPWA